jgi:hypothetical protein
METKQDYKGHSQPGEHGGVTSQNIDSQPDNKGYTHSEEHTESDRVTGQDIDVRQTNKGYSHSRE